MTIVKVGPDRYINVDRMTYVEPARKGRLVIHFAVGGGDIAGPACKTELDGQDAHNFRLWLDAQSRQTPA